MQIRDSSGLFRTRSGLGPDSGPEPRLDVKTYMKMKKFEKFIYVPDFSSFDADTRFGVKTYTKMHSPDSSGLVRTRSGLGSGAAFGCKNIYENANFAFMFRTRPD